MKELKLQVRTIGFLLLFLGTCQLLPTLVAFFEQENSKMAFLSSLLTCITVSITCLRVKAKSQQLSTKGSLVLLALSWTIFCVFGSLPYIFSGILSPMDAFFEAVSGFTTTGSSVIQDIEVLDKAILIWRSQTQWLGGIGIVIVSVVLFPYSSQVDTNLIRKDLPFNKYVKMLPSFRSVSRQLVVFYVIITLVFALLFNQFGMSWFEAICHSFSGISTGGFSTRNLGIGAFTESSIHWTATAISFLGGVNFYLIIQAVYTRSILAPFRDIEFQVYFILIGLISLIVAFILYQNSLYSYAESLQYGFFQVTSLMTTTGFTNQNYDLWPASIQIIFILLMLIGGCTGSTTGSFKVYRLIVMFQVVRVLIFQYLHPRAIKPFWIGSELLSEETIRYIGTFFFVGVVVLLFSTGALMYLGLDPLTAFTAVVACTTGSGPGLAGVGPYQNFSQIPEVGKFILSLDMLFGRLEFFAFFALAFSLLRKK